MNHDSYTHTSINTADTRNWSQLQCLYFHQCCRMLTRCKALLLCGHFTGSQGWFSLLGQFLQSNLSVLSHLSFMFVFSTLFPMVTDACSQEVKGGFQFLARFFDHHFHRQFCLTYYQSISAVHPIRPTFWWRFCCNGCHFLTLVCFI